MKKLFILALILCFLSNIAQTTNPLNSQLTFVNQSSVTSGIIYERTSRTTNLFAYNQPNGTHNTADFSFFKQVLGELHYGSNQTRLISNPELLNRNMAGATNLNEVNIGIINSALQVMNFDTANAANGGLTFDGTYFRQILNKVPFYDLQALVIAPLKDVVSGNTITYKFNSNLILNNGNLTIKNLVANFGDNVNRNIISNGALINNSITVNNAISNATQKITFTVTLSNNIVIITYGEIFISKFISTTPFRNGNTPCDGDVNAEDVYPTTSLIEAEEAYPGYGESTGTKGKLEVRVFYDPSHNKTLRKPILIVDGFDPGDSRKITDCDCENDPTGDCQKANKNGITKQYDPQLHESLQEKMGYVDNSIIPNVNENLITILRSKGYDVAVVNLPTYTSAQGVKIDGGADYIERNGLALVALLKKFNEKLITNGSTEKMVIVGPSMGGQISRYALAYMEKKLAETNIPTWNHNTSLWIAFDSPNHGANVPFGDQALINILRDGGANPEVDKLYKEKINAIAAKQLSIEQHQQTVNEASINYGYLNGQTTAQGMPTNSGNPWFQEHFTNQFTNGLPNSKGFPMNCRKIAVVNGSLSGVKQQGNDNELMLDTRLFTYHCYRPFNIWGFGPKVCYTTKLATAQARILPSYGASSEIAMFDKYRSNPQATYIYNYNTRGNMDLVPGGTINATADIHSEITGTGIKSRSFWEYPRTSLTYFYTNILGGPTQWDTRTLVPNQCFIPTFSGLAIKNPNQSWASSLNRNLVCSNETYFDSYFGESENTEHIKLNYRSVKWLLKELDNNPQAPYFPLEENLLTGPNVVCENINTTFSIIDICKTPSPVKYNTTAGVPVNGWSVEGNIVIVSSTPYTVIVKGIANGLGKIIATFQNGQFITKTIWAGKPMPYYTAVRENLCTFFYTAKDYPNNPDSMTNYSWQYVNGTGGASANNFYANQAFAQFTACPPFSITLKLIASNLCGTEEQFVELWLNNSEEEINRINPVKDTENIKNDNRFIVYPNPSNDIVNIDLNDQNNQPQKNATISGELFDMMGQSKVKVEVNNNIATFSVQGLNKGIYILKIFINGVIENHQIAVE